MTPRSKEKFRKFVALVTTLSQLQTQVLFAGIPMGAGPLPIQIQLAGFLKKINHKISDSGLSVFHAYPYSNLIDPRGQTDLPDEGRTSPDHLLDREQKQMSILRQMEELQIFQQDTFQGRPKLPQGES